VGSFPPNPWGLFDLHGNVFEWCQDAGEPCDKQSPPTFQSFGGRVLRGGCWKSGPFACRSAVRLASVPTYRSLGFGCRVVCVE
jgi:formylglycine-generating enzyme required for sulfatase activity